MAEIALGNLAFWGHAKQWDYVASGDVTHNLTLAVSAMSIIDQANLNTERHSYMHQPGSIASIKMYVGEDAGSRDLEVLFVKRVSTGGGSGHAADLDFQMILKPAGKTGWFCSPLSIPIADRSWGARDVCGIKLHRIGTGTSGPQVIHMGILLQIDEEFRITSPP